VPYFYHDCLIFIDGSALSVRCVLSLRCLCFFNQNKENREPRALQTQVTQQQQQHVIYIHLASHSADYRDHVLFSSSTSLMCVWHSCCVCVCFRLLVRWIQTHTLFQVKPWECVRSKLSL